LPIFEKQAIFFRNIDVIFPPLEGTMLTRMILVLNNKELQKHLEEGISLTNVQVECLGHEKNSWQKVVQSCGDVIVISESFIPLPAESGIAMLNNLPETPTTVILQDIDSSEQQAQLMAAGADVVLYSGISLRSLIEAIEATLESRQQFIQIERFDHKGQAKPKIADFVSNSEVMQIFMNEVQQVAPSDSLLLILGETGVGKEHLAKVIHSESPRAAGPFVAVNTAALPEQLLESELFGYTRGAFTGATRSRRGAFEQAHGGTIFLDEIGEMPLHLQSKLLRVLQDYEIRPIGSEKPIWVDVRVIAATNRELEEEVAEGSFRKDLFYRLSVVTLKIPSLRDRREDIPSLARRFINNFRHKIGRDVSYISEPVMKALCSYDWPGNVRELMNVIERSMLLCKTEEISLQDLPTIFHTGESLPKNPLIGEIDLTGSWQGRTLPAIKKELVDLLEAMYLKMVLKETGGRISLAAQIAGINTRSLFNKMKDHGIKKEDFKK
jgi:two-component system, NtrC family, response regulator AtoC